MVFLNVVEALNDVTHQDDNGQIVDNLIAGQGDAVLDTDDIDYETEHDSRYLPPIFNSLTKRRERRRF